MKLRLVALLSLAVTSIGLPLSGQTSNFDSSQPIPIRLLTQVEIRRFVAQLGSPSSAKQKEAKRILVATGLAAAKELFLAQSSDDEALAARAKETLSALPQAKFWLQNAAGKPVDHCRIEFFDMVPFSSQLADVPFARGSTSSAGGVALPALPPEGAFAFRVTHPQFGTTVTRFSESETAMLARQQRFTFRNIWLPIVPQTFAYRSRAVDGVVQDESGQPIPGAEVHCRYLRTNGGNGISAITPRSCVVTGRSGKFRLYMPSLQPTERGDFRMRMRVLRRKPLPENCEYQLVVRVPGDLTYCPVEVWQGNARPAVITLSRTSRKRRLAFEAADGGLISEKEDLAKITLRHRPLKPDASDQWVEIDQRIVLKGGPVHAGRYWASYETDDGTRISWQNLIVTDVSPDELTFRLPPPVIYRGRVVDPVDGKPLAGVFVGGYRSGTQKTLASITDDEWSAAEKLPNDPPVTAAALKPFLQVNGFRQIVRTSKDGRFELHQPREFRFYGIAAFARNRMPIRDRVFPETAGTVIPDLPLFPAAKIKVHPVPPSAAEQQDARRFQTSPRAPNRVSLFWSFPEKGQPTWTSIFQKLIRERVHSKVGRTYEGIPVNRTSLRYVPAEMPIRLEFQTDDNAGWIPRNPEPLRLSQGEVSDLGALTFAPAISIQIRAVGPKGAPVAGVAIRRLMKRGAESVWATGHETNANGIAVFNVPRNATVKFLTSPEILLHGKYFSVQLEVKTKNFPPREPFQIRLTDEQIKILFNRNAATE